MRHVVLGLFSLSCLGSCAFEVVEGDEEDQVSSVAQAASQWSGVNYWPRVSNRYEVNVCFHGDTDATRRQRFQDILTETWEKFSAVDFVFQGTCPGTPPTSWMPLGLIYNSEVPNAWGGKCWAGEGGRIPVQENPFYANSQCEFTYGSAMYATESIAVHEVGHGLGFRHEHGRSDWPGTAEGIWSTTYPSSALDAWGCYRHPSGASNEGAGPYHPVESGPTVTPPDGTSIMAPWSCDTNRRGASNFWELSYYDSLGVEIVYPHSFTRGVRSNAGFVTTTNGLVVRSNGYIATDWTMRGALSSAYSSNPVWTWNFINYSGLTLPVSYLGTGTKAVSVSVTDFLNRSHSGAAVVVVNDSLHTAILMTSMIPG